MAWPQHLAKTARLSGDAHDLAAVSTRADSPASASRRSSARETEERPTPNVSAIASRLCPSWRICPGAAAQQPVAHGRATRPAELSPRRADRGR